MGRGYRHFDYPISFEVAKGIVSSETKVSQHSFRPLISYEKVQRRFKGFDENGQAIIQHKSRLICYASHRDSQIYAYYAAELEKKYAALRKTLGIDDCVLAYRSGKQSNIHMANEVFEAIKSREECSVIALDISRFFDSINHAGLKKQWCRVLGKTNLPDDHYNLFKSLTRFSRVDLERCIAALNIPQKALKKSTEPLCNDSVFHEKVCGRLEGYKNLVITNTDGRHAEKNSLNWLPYGIPQGTPISAVLSNVFMMDFDVRLKEIVDKHQGIYRRYSDDILVICPTKSAKEIEAEIMRMVSEAEISLKINPSKTEYTKFARISEKELSCQRLRPDGTWASGAVQYLGLSFDGKKKALRHSTVARYQRKTKYAVRNARRTAEHFKKDSIRSQKLYVDLTDIGSQSMPSYAKRVSQITGDNASTKQVGNHKKVLKKLIEEQDAIIAEKRNR